MKSRAEIHPVPQRIQKEFAVQNEKKSSRLFIATLFKSRSATIAFSHLRVKNYPLSYLSIADDEYDDDGENCPPPDGVSGVDRVCPKNEEKILPLVTN